MLFCLKNVEIGVLGGKLIIVHRSDFQTGKHFKAVAHHFSQQNHKMSDMRFLPFEVVHSGDPMELASRESFWIEKKQLLEFGMNRQK